MWKLVLLRPLYCSGVLKSYLMSIIISILKPCFYITSKTIKKQYGDYISMVCYKKIFFFWVTTPASSHVHHVRGSSPRPTLMHLGWAEWRYGDVTPGRPCSLPGFALCPRICRDCWLHRLQGDMRREKSWITLQGKLVRPKLVSVRWGAANNGSFLSDSDFKGRLSDCSELYFVVDHWGNSQMFSHMRHHYSGSRTR